MKTFKTISVIGTMAVLLASLSGCGQQGVIDTVEVEPAPSVIQGEDTVLVPSEDAIKEDEEIVGGQEDDKIGPTTGEGALEDQPTPPAASDTDGDGVLNGIDECANTPKGTIVAEDGCLQLIINPGLFGNLVSNYQPKLTSSYPQDKAIDIPLTAQALSVKFNVKVDSASLKSHLKLKVFAGLGFFDVETTYFTTVANGGSITPTAPLKFAATYIIVVEKGLLTEKGISTEDIVITFTTENLPKTESEKTGLQNAFEMIGDYSKDNLVSAPADCTSGELKLKINWKASNIVTIGVRRLDDDTATDKFFFHYNSYAGPAASGAFTVNRSINSTWSKVDLKFHVTVQYEDGSFGEYDYERYNFATCTPEAPLVWGSNSGWSPF